MSPAAVYFIAAEHIQFQTVYERMWAKHHLFVIDTDTSAVWCLTIVIRTGNIKTEDQYWMNFISWKCWTGKRRVMALHDIDCLISIISEHSTWGGGTIPRHGQCEHTVAAALACGSRRPPSIATPPPSHYSHFSWLGSLCHVQKDPSLLFLVSAKVSYPRIIAINVLFIWWDLWINQIFQ